jgi:hypothetical protein
LFNNECLFVPSAFKWIFNHLRPAAARVLDHELT